MTLPPPASYADIHSGSQVPPMPMTRIVQYLDTQEKKFEDKFKAMYEQRQVCLSCPGSSGTSSHVLCLKVHCDFVVNSS